jgi:cysteine desulfurase/selenocysteine lyase
MSIAGELPSGGGVSGQPGVGMPDLSAQIAELANALFQSGPGATPALPSGVPTTPAALVPPNPGPSALSLGAGGVSSAQTLPPVPGFLHAPPLAASPAPKESDLRNAGALLAELGGVQPITLVSQVPPHPSDGAPYFLALAGLPAGALPAASAPASPTDSAEPLPRVPDTRAALAEFRPELVAYGSEAQPESRAVRSPALFDPYAVKRDFPILGERVRGRPLVWLDNAATTQKPRAVIERLAYFYEHENSNVHRGAHTLAARATDAYEAARDKVRRFLNAPSLANIVFVRGATEGINLVAQSWGRRHVQAGDEIVITWLEHHANIVPWQQLCAEKSAKLRVAPVDSRGQVILEEYERLLGPRTKLVAMTQVSNALGSVVPVAEMTAMAHRHGACVLIDGAQAVSHLPADVQALDCEFYVFSGHKVFAPTGIGAVYGKSAVLDSMPPWQGGGNMIEDVTFEKTRYQRAPNRFEAGTGNIADAVGLGAALDYVSSLGIHNIARYEHELLEYGTERLASVPGLTLIGTAAEKAGVLSFVLDGQRTEEVGGLLDQEGIAVRSGHHCAQPILRRFGLESSVRASLAPYNTREDIDALVAALNRLQAGYSGLGRGAR